MTGIALAAGGAAVPDADTEPAPSVSGFDASDLLARRGRLLPLSADVAAHPPRGDHLLNPDLFGALTSRRLKDAAVLVPLVDRAGPLSAILTQRATHLASHAGQVAFPGGKLDPDDPDPAAAALREAEEEIGLDRGLVEPIGYGAPYLTNSGYRIFPVVAVVAPTAIVRPNPDEVDAIFEVPWPFLMSPANHLKASRVWEGRERFYYRMPFGERLIWGVTAGIVRTLFEQLYD